MPLEFPIAHPFTLPENHLTNENKMGTHERLMAVMLGFWLRGGWGRKERFYV